MTEEELEAIEREHYRSEGASILYDYPLCNCTAAWPCDATRLLAEVRDLRQELTAELMVGDRWQADCEDAWAEIARLRAEVARPESDLEDESAQIANLMERD